MHCYEQLHPSVVNEQATVVEAKHTFVQGVVSAIRIAGQDCHGAGVLGTAARSDEYRLDHDNASEQPQPCAAHRCPRPLRYSIPPCSLPRLRSNGEYTDAVNADPYACPATSVMGYSSVTEDGIREGIALLEKAAG